VAHPNDEYDQALVKDLVQDAVVPAAHAEDATGTLQLLHTRRPWIASQRLDHGLQPTPHRRRELA
jgi:hypothetical protein